jgi:hypothetical protein
MEYKLNSKFLCSVYPGKLEPIVRSYGIHHDARKGRRTVFQFQPVDRFAQDTKKRYSVIEVVDSWENIPNPTKPTPRSDGRMPFDSGPVACEEIVKDLLNVWCGSILGLPTGVTPGVMEIINSVPTQAELEKLYQKQAEFAQYMVQEGDRLAADKKMKQITNPMRESVKYLQAKRDWADPGAAADNTSCPACRQLIHSEQIVCHHCRTQLKALPPNLAAVNPAAVARPQNQGNQARA